MGGFQPGKTSGTAGYDDQVTSAQPRSPAPGKSTLVDVYSAAPKPGDPVPGGPAAPAPPNLPAIAADELVLTRQPTQANESTLPWFKVQVVTKLRAWCLTLDETRVHCATDGAAPVIVLRWDAAWGTQPITRELPATLDPLDAKASVGATHKLHGWAKVAADDQTRLDALLGGESNNVSIAARDNLRGTFSGLAGKTDDQQATALQGLLTDKAAQPAVVNEQVSNAKVNFTLAGPTLHKHFQFRGVKADAEQWHAKYDDSVDVLITAPKAPTAGLHYPSVKEAADAASYLPKTARKLITNVLLNAQVNPDDAYWATQYKQPGFHSYMTAGVSGVVTVYPDATALPDANYMRGTVQHETGHTWSKKQWGEDTTKGKWGDWKKAMDADKVSVSGYAQASMNEDVAETIQTYVSTQGTPKHDEYKAIVPARYAILEKEYK